MLHEKPEELIKSSIESFEIEPDIETINRIEETINKTNQERSIKIENFNDRIKKLQQDYKVLQDELTSLNKSDRLNETLNTLGKSNDNLKSFYDDNDNDYDNDEFFTNNNNNNNINSNDENIFKIMNSKSIELDNLKIHIAKKLNDFENQLNSLNLNKINLIKEKSNLINENENLINNNLLNNFDSKIMKINLYKNLGIFIENGNENDEVETPNNINNNTNNINKTDKNDKIIIYNKFSDLTNFLNVDDKYSDYFITNYIWDKLPGL